MKKLIIVPGLLALIAASCQDQPQISTPQNSTVVQQVERFRSGLNQGQQRTRPDQAVSKPVAVTKPQPAVHRNHIDGGATIVPAAVAVTLRPGECSPIHKTVFLPGSSTTRADILFSVDRTGSMDGEIVQLQLQIQSIADQLATLIDDPAFGVISYMDYPSGYSHCGYTSTYGTPGDLPYILNQAVNTDVNLTKTAIAGLTLGDGSDGPEAYARPLFESYSDPAINWRPGARRIVVNVGDNVPHDCDLGACLGLPGLTTGVDPGRDGIAGTADDLPILSVIAGMAANNTTLIHINSEGVFPSTQQDLWQCWADQTPGGISIQINSDGTVPGGIDLAQLIFQRVGIVIAHCGTLTLQGSAGFESWVQNLSPASYPDVDLPATVTFDLNLCVPAGTAPGTYNFQICAICDREVKVCEDDQVTVPSAVSTGFFTGGGHIPGGRPQSRTFGFNAGFHGSDTSPSGDLEYNDHDTKKKVHSTSVVAFSVTDDCCTFSGACKVDNVAGFTYEVTACDHGEPGAGHDTFAITVRNSGGAVVLQASGVLAGGNIQKHAGGGGPGPVVTRHPAARY